jgi:hypothetical protein
MMSGNEADLCRSLHFFLGRDDPIRPGFLFEVRQDRQDINKKVANHDKDFDNDIGPTVETSI